LGISNLESRIVKLENTAKTEFGTPVSAVFFPVRKLMLAEERSHDEDGVAFPVLVATWDRPAGVLLPDSIRLIHNDTTVSLPGTATSYRMTGYAVDTTVSVKVTAIYAQGNSSTIIAEKTISGDIEPPSVPTNLTVTGGFRTLTLRWENPTAEDFSHVEIWESITDNNIATAERIAQAYGTEFVRSNCAVLETRWYWIRAIDTHGNYSDFTSVASGTTNAIQASDIPINTISESMLISELASEINKIPAIEVDVNLINQELDAEAGQRLLLAAKVDNNLSAIQSEATARANADSAMASQIATLQATTGDNTAAIQIVEDVRMGEVNVFRQATAPTSGMITGDLWIDNTEVVHRYEGGEWVSKEGTPVYDLLKTAIAQYVVKTQAATGDGQLKVAGFGLYNDATTGSEFAILADKFYVYAQKEDGSSYSNIQVFTVDTTTTPPTVGINGNLIVDGSITGDKINAAAKIQLGDGGEFITGANSIVQMASGVITLDSEGGIIQVRNPANVATGDFVKIETGDITTYKYINGAYAPMKSLRKMATGVATNNVTTTLPGAWPSIPEIIVSPKQLQSFVGGTYANSNQVMELAATNVSRNSTTGVVTFVPQARLVISASSGTVTPPASGSGVIAKGGIGTSGTFYSSTVSPSIAVTTLTISASCYGQAGVEWWETHGGLGGEYTYGADMTNVSYALYVVINGSSHLIKTGKFNRAVNDVSTEPSSALYAAGTASQTFTINGVVSTIQAYAVFTKADAFVSMGTSAALYGKVNKCWVKINSISYALSGSTQLATGTLNYMAIAE
jgi:hypothetical protein